MFTVLIWIAKTAAWGAQMYHLSGWLILAIAAWVCFHALPTRRRN